MCESNRKPCAECPFSRAIEPASTGGADPAIYIGQAYGPFLLPCHMDPNYKKDQRDPGLIQCAGAAAFRANVCRDVLMPKELLRCPPDEDLVFAESAELLAHHKQCTIEEARKLLAAVPPARLLEIEMTKLKGIILHDRKKITDGKRRT